MTLLRRVLGETLRGRRLRQQRTLREVSGTARVSLGYLSEVERGQKEASSELLAAFCDALDIRLSELLREVSEAMRRTERGGDVARVPTRPLVPAGAGTPTRHPARPSAGSAPPSRRPQGSRPAGSAPGPRRAEPAVPAVVEPVDLGPAELDAVDLDAVDLDAVDLGAVDLGAIELTADELAAMDLAAMDLAAAELPGRPLVEELAEFDAPELDEAELDGGVPAAPTVDGLGEQEVVGRDLPDVDLVGLESRVDLLGQGFDGVQLGEVAPLLALGGRPDDPHNARCELAGAAA